MTTGPTAFLSQPKAGSIEHRWSEALADKFDSGKDENVRLLEAIDAISYRAKMGLGAALAEWLLWRFEGHADLARGHRAVEACWAAVVHPAYAKPLGFEPEDEPVFSKVPEVDGPLQIGLSILREIRGRYAKGKTDLAGSVTRLALLAQHVVPVREEFDAWLTATLRRAAKSFPRGPEYERGGRHDATKEVPVCRAFFLDPGFELSKQSNRAELEALLAKLDPAANPFLRTPAEMKDEGFTGTAYRLP